MLGGFFVEFVGWLSSKRQIQITLPSDGDVVLQQKFECAIEFEHQFTLGSHFIPMSTSLLTRSRRSAVFANSFLSTVRCMPGASCLAIRFASSNLSSSRLVISSSNRTSS